MAKKETKKTTKKSDKRKSWKNIFSRFWSWIKGIFRKIKNIILRRKAINSHRSFRLSKKRDYTRKYPLIPYWKLLGKSWKIFWENKKLFIGMTLVYSFLTFLMVGITSNENYTTAREAVAEYSAETLKGNFIETQEAAATLIGMALGGQNAVQSEGGRIIAGMMILVVWMSSVWALRRIFNGQRVRLKDALYNSGRPLIPTFCLMIVLLIQLFPFALGVAGIVAVNNVGFQYDNIGIMLLTLGAFLLAVLSIYWIMSTIFGLINVTNDSYIVYPMQAWREGGEVVVGRRLGLVLRMAWLVLWGLVLWLVIFTPLILLDNWTLEHVDWLNGFSLVPFLLIVYGSFTVIFFAIYIYTLYRETLSANAKEEAER